jgi:hypothetical protein
VIFKFRSNYRRTRTLFIDILCSIKYRHLHSLTILRPAYMIVSQSCGDVCHFNDKLSAQLYLVHRKCDVIKKKLYNAFNRCSIHINSLKRNIQEGSRDMDLVQLISDRFLYFGCVH